MTFRKALVVVNRNARRGGDGIEPALATLAASGVETEIVADSPRENVSPLIVARARDVDVVVVAGGDGSLNAAARGVMETGLPLGILPCGTANDLARTLGLPTDLVEAAKAIRADAVRAIDVGEVNGIPFFNVASLGLSVELAHALDADAKRRFGRLSYALAALKVLSRARPFRAAIVAKGVRERVRTLQIAVGNGRFYGGGMTVHHDASIDDGRLQLYSLELDEIWKLIALAPSFRSGHHGAWEEVRVADATAFDVTTRRPREINADGEILTKTPARFRIKPGAVKVCAPGSN